MRSVARFFLLLALCAPLVAQQAAGRLTGSVVDPSGAAIPSATIQVMMPGGSRAVLSTATTADGLFSIPSIPAGTYDVIVEAPGFRKSTLRAVEITPGRITELKEIKLEVGAVAETVEVTASAQGVQTTTAEVSLNITRQQVQELPVLNRSPQAFVMTQAGVNSGRGSPTINGQRTTFTNVTIDGINIQDNFIRTNAVNFSPFVLLLDQVAEFTVATSNTSAAQGGGASQVLFVTPSGSNRYRGSVFWHNRNNALAANTWFNNQSRVANPFLNQNQAGGSIGGPILRDKLFFYVNYEAFRVRQQTTANRAILTAEARQGIYTYRDTSGNVRKVNVLQAAGLQADPATAAILQNVPGPDKINNFDTGDSSAALLRNTAGYRFNIRNNRTQDHITAKLDWNLSTKHTFSGTYIWNSDIIDRPDVSNDYSTYPKVINDDISELFSVGWRWNPTPTITNELRGGRSFPPVIFASEEKFGNYILAPAGGQFANPLNTFRTQGRNPTTYNLMDNASYVRGKHTIQFGFQSQTILVEPFNEAGITPTYTLGVSTANPLGLSGTQLPGISSTDNTGANNLLANLAGIVTSYTQSFNVKDRTSGFVSGASNIRHWKVSNYSGYVNDSWKALPRLNLNLGVRYEYYTRVNERDGLALFPVLANNNVVQTMVSNATLNFAGSAVNRPFYNADKNNFAPNVGLAWDLFGNGRTALRAGYSVNFVNDEFVVAFSALAGTNGGLGQAVSATGLSARTSALPAITAPTFTVPRTFANNNALNASSNFAAPDPNLRTPYIQQWSLGVQHEYKGMVFELRYVGNHGTKLLRALDHNQVIIRENGFLADFLRAQSNGNLARAATGVFNPAYNASIPGSQPLTFFPLLPNGGSLGTAGNRTLIDQGAVGELASTYQTTRANGNISFFPNAVGLATNIMTNYANSTYNSLQFDVRSSRPLRGLIYQANYTWSKVLSDAQAGSENAFQARNEAMLDRFNPQLEKSRAPFDLPHVIKGNFVYELPAGPGHRFHRPGLGWLLGGWQISGIFVTQSGNTFSVFSGRGTLNRGGQSGQNTVNTLLNGDQLRDLFQFRMTGSGPYYVAASAVGPDGRAVAADGAAPFSGQVFFQPAAGTVGSLQRRYFNAPWLWSLDFAASKRFKIGERHEFTLRMDSANIFNHPSFAVGDQTVTSTTFGKITGTSVGRRVVQFSLKYSF